MGPAHLVQLRLGPGPGLDLARAGHNMAEAKSHAPAAASEFWATLRLAAFTRDAELATGAVDRMCGADRALPLPRATAITYSNFLARLLEGDLLDTLVCAESPPAAPAAVAEAVARFILEGDVRIDKQEFADYFVWYVLQTPALAHLLPLVEPACSVGRVAKCLELQARAAP
jgi:hypothetical protein